LEANLKAYEEKLFETWETLPGYFVSSAETHVGKNEILEFIDDINHPEKQTDKKI
jgi:GTP-binding protein